MKIVTHDIFGNHLQLEGEIIGEVRQYGFNLNSGGWCLYEPKNDTPYTIAEFICFKPKGKRKVKWINKNDIRYIEEDTNNA